MGNKSGKSKKKDATVLTEVCRPLKNKALLNNCNLVMNFLIFFQEEIQFLLKNTNYTREQINKWHRGFLADCPTGQLDKKKFLVVYQQFYPRGKAEKFSTEIFK